MFYVGQVSPEARQLCEVTKEALDAGGCTRAGGQGLRRRAGCRERPSSQVAARNRRPVRRQPVGCVPARAAAADGLHMPAPPRPALPPRSHQDLRAGGACQGDWAHHPRDRRQAQVWGRQGEACGEPLGARRSCGGLQPAAMHPGACGLEQSAGRRSSAVLGEGGARARTPAAPTRPPVPIPDIRRALWGMAWARSSTPGRTCRTTATASRGRCSAA